MAAMVEATVERYGRVDVLYNNAGAGIRKKLHEHTDEEWNFVLNTNLNAMFRGARAVLEVRSREVPFVLEHSQIIGRLVFERLTDTPPQVYGQALGSNYQRQGLKLSKHFRAPE